MPNEKDEFLVYGTYEQIKAELVRLKNQQIMLKNLQVEGGGGDSERVIPPNMTGKIMLKLTFLGKTIKGKEVRSRHRFRLMNDDPKTITLNRIMELGNKVYSKFNKMILNKGKTTYTYNDPENGISNSFGYFANIADAQKLYESILDISGKSPEWKYLSTSTYPLPGDRFSDPPEKVQQIGQQVRLPEERPIAIVTFKKCEIKFPKIKKSYELCNDNGLVLRSLDFLKQYQD